MNMNFTRSWYRATVLPTLCLWVLLVLWGLQPALAQTIAFPGAEGAGRFATGGRGTPAQPTTVFEVTNLSDDNAPGSLRYAVSASQTTYPYRTIVFRVAGTIHLNAKLNIRANTTIAGQTAPGGGICIADHPVVISGDNVILRYLRIRMGDKNQNKGKVDGSGGDDVLGNLGGKNIIIDHCSVSWSSDECLTIYRGDSLTIQWSLVSEPLNYSYHYEDPGPDFQEHGYGGIWGAKRGSFHHNLIAHVKGRAPRFAGSSTYTPNTAGTENGDFRNNVIYNWISYSTNGGDGGNYNVVNNYYKSGPSTSNGNSAGIPIRYMIMNPSKSTLPYPQVYLAGNYVDGSAEITANNWKGIAMAGGSLADTSQSKVGQPFDIAPLNMHSATEAYELVLQQAGAQLPLRDTLDQRIINDVRNRTGRVIDVQGGYSHGTAYEQTVNAWPTLAAGTAPADDDHDGMPNDWEIAKGLNPNNAADRAIINEEGYTNLELYLNSIGVSTEPTLGIQGTTQPFNQLIGSPSAVQTYNIGGSLLTGLVTVTPPANFQVSTDGNTWSSNASPLTLTPVAGSLNIKLFVRLNAGTVGSYSGNITHTAAGVAAVDLAVTGVTKNSTAPINADLIVAKDGSGNYTSLQAAIDAAPTARTTPFVIYIKNGIYKEKINIPSNKPFIHLVGESVANTIVTYDDYSGKVVNGTTIGTSTSATITISANDCLASNITFENATGYTGDGPQALAINVSGDRCAFSNCRFIGGQDTVLANGNGKRQYFKNCYIDGNTDFIFGSSIAVFDSCVIYPRDRVDGANGGYVTAANTPQGQAYGYVFLNCRITKNRGITSYTLGRPWQNDAGSTDATRAHNKTVFINAVMGSSIRPEGWSTWNEGTNTSVMTYAEYKTQKWDGTLLNTNQRVAWSKQLSEADAANYTLAGIFSNWDPCSLSAALCTSQPVELAVSNMRVQRGSSRSTLSWNLSWPVAAVKYELYRSTDNIQFHKVNEVQGGVDSVVAFAVEDALPAPGTTYYYYVKASKAGMIDHNSLVVSVNTATPLDGEFRSAGSGFWTNTAAGNTMNAVSIWEKYIGATGVWQLQNLGVAPSNVNVTIRAGHTVVIDALKSINNLTIEQGGILKSNGGFAAPATTTLRVGAGSAADVVIRNDGVWGGDANPDDLFVLEFTTSCRTVLITGTGVTKITRLRPLPGNPNPLTVTFDQDMSISYNSGGFTAYYNNTSNLTTEKVTYVINEGKTVRLTHPNGSFNATPNNTPNPGGQYSYQINGTLDLTATTATSHVVPFSNNATSVININVGSKGVMKLGTSFNTINSTPGAANGKVLLNIADGGLVDATKTTSLTLGSNYFITEGTGALKRTVGNTAVGFPVGTAATGLLPVVISKTAGLDTFTVRVKNNFDQAPASPLQVVNAQYTISKETADGSAADVKLGWLTGSQAAGFDAAKPVSLLRYTGSTWESTTAVISGTGTVADPAYAAATGINQLGTFIVSNYYPSVATQASLTAFSQINGTPSAAQSFNLSGLQLSADLVITAPAGYQLSTNGGTSWNNPVTLTPVGGVITLTAIQVRLYASTMGAYDGAIKLSSTGLTDVLIAVEGTTAAGPTLAATGTLTAFAQTVGNASVVQTYKIEGSILSGPVTITPPDNYQVSANGGTNWYTKASPLSLPVTAGALGATTITVRLNASTPGSYAGPIIHSSTGANAVHVAVTGTTVGAPAVSTTAALKAFAQTKGTPGAAQTYTLNGVNLTGSLSVTVPAGFEVSDNGTNWYNTATPLVLTPVNGTVTTTISVRLNAPDAGTYSGNLLHVTNGAANVSLAVTGVTINAPAMVYTPALQPFAQTLGTPSGAQLFSISGQFLTGNLTIRPSAGFEISVDGYAWTGSDKTLGIVPANGVVTARNLQVRMNIDTVGPHQGSLTIATNNATDIKLPLLGTTVPGFVITPNPAHNWLVVYHPKLYTIGKLYIYNMNGRNVGTHYTRTASGNTSINISALPPGVYFVEYRVNQEAVMMKFVKQ